MRPTLRESNPALRAALADELQILFREIQKRRHPDLSKDGWMELFRIWLEHYLAKCEFELAAMRERVAGIDRERLKLFAKLRETTSRRQEVFTCRCGAVIADPLDPEQMRIHSPHFHAASLDRTYEGIKRWRNHARRRVE